MRAAAVVRPRSFSGSRLGFPPTQWTLVLAAGDQRSPEVQAALETLCTTYWRPVYAFLRRLRCTIEDAEDLTQDFFYQLLEKQSLTGVDPSKGRFRSFLMAVAGNLNLNHLRHTHAQKRGGKVTFVTFDDGLAEQLYQQTPSDGLSPQDSFDQVWRLALLRKVLDRLQAEEVEAGNRELFEALKGSLTYVEPGLYRKLGERFGCSADAIKTRKMRLRDRWVEILRSEVANTVANPADVDDELRALLGGVG